MGVAGALGLSFQLSKYFNIRFECSGQSIYPYTKKSVRTSYIINEVESISSLPISEKEIELVKQSNELGKNNNPNRPAKELSTPRNYSNMGLMLHFEYILARRK